MGQVQSDDAAAGPATPQPAADRASPLSSIDDLLAESTAFAGSGDESLDVKAQKALECPCVAELRSGPCGTQFSEAFVCFFKSTAEEKGSDCVNPFIALQYCIKANPNAFSKDVLGEEDSKKEDDNMREHKILAPTWSKEERSKL